MNERNKGVILSYIQVFLNVIVKIIYVPLLLHFLGKNEYGLYQLAGSFFSYVTVFESSISGGVLRNYCKAVDLHDDNLANDTLSTARKIYRVLSLLIAIAGIILSFVFHAFYRSSLSSYELLEGTIILGVLFINMIITVLGSVYLTIITGNEKFIFINVLNIVKEIVQPFLVILFVIRIPYALVIVVVMTVLNLLAVMLRYLYTRNKLGIIIKGSNSDPTLVKEIMGLASTILLASIADQIFWKADQLILGKLYGTAIVAVYSVGSQIYNIYMQFGIKISGIYYPKASSLYYEENGLKKVSDLFTEIGRITFLILMLILSGFIIFGKEFLLFWVGQGYEQAYYVALVVMIPFSIDLAQNIGLSILQITGQYGFRAKMYLFAAFLNIVSTIVMSIYMGMVGAALSTGLTMLITSGFIMNWYYSKKVGLNIKEYWEKCLPIIMWTICLTSVMFLIKQKFLGNIISFVGFMLQILVYIIIYYFCMHKFVMNAEEKKLVSQALHRKK